MGIYSAIYPRRLLSRLIMGLSTIGVSVPIFLIAILLIYVFAIELNWLPSYGRGQTVNVWGWESGILTVDGLKHLILPTTALTALMLPLFVRLIRSEMMEVLQTEYVKFAWAKGLPRVRIWFVHAFKNTLLPVITVGGVQIGTMIAFTILTKDGRPIGNIGMEEITWRYRRVTIGIIIAALIAGTFAVSAAAPAALQGGALVHRLAGIGPSVEWTETLLPTTAERAAGPARPQG